MVCLEGADNVIRSLFLLLAKVLSLSLSLVAALDVIAVDIDDERAKWKSAPLLLVLRFFKGPELCSSALLPLSSSGHSERLELASLKSLSSISDEDCEKPLDVSNRRDVVEVFLANIFIVLALGVCVPPEPEAEKKALEMEMREAAAVLAGPSECLSRDGDLELFMVIF